MKYKTKSDFGNNFDLINDIFLKRIDKSPYGPSNSDNYPDCHNDCWRYTYRLDRDGYGVLSVKHYTIQAHIFAYISLIGNITFDGIICHKCDIRNCVNPNHLYLGTFKNNKHDCIIRNRLNSPVGKQLPQTSLTDNQIKTILIDIWNDKYLSIQQIADDYDVDYYVIYNILQGRNGKHITNQLSVPLIDIKNKVTRHYCKK